MRKYEFQELIENYCGHLSTERMARAAGMSRRSFYYRIKSKEGFTHKELAGLSRLTIPCGLTLEQLEIWHKEIYK